MQENYFYNFILIQKESIGIKIEHSQYCGCCCNPFQPESLWLFDEQFYIYVVGGNKIVIDSESTWVGIKYSVFSNLC